MRRTRDSSMPRLSLGWKLWFAFCGLLGLGLTGLVVVLILAGISYLDRH